MPCKEVSSSPDTGSSPWGGRKGTGVFFPPNFRARLPQGTDNADALHKHSKRPTKQPGSTSRPTGSSSCSRPGSASAGCSAASTPSSCSMLSVSSFFTCSEVSPAASNQCHSLPGTPHGYLYTPAQQTTATLLSPFGSPEAQHGVCDARGSPWSQDQSYTAAWESQQQHMLPCQDPDMFLQQLEAPPCSSVAQGMSAGLLHTHTSSCIGTEVQTYPLLTPGTSVLATHSLNLELLFLQQQQLSLGLTSAPQLAPVSECQQLPPVESPSTALLALAELQAAAGLCMTQSLGPAVSAALGPVAAHSIGLPARESPGDDFSYGVLPAAGGVGQLQGFDSSFSLAQTLSQMALQAESGAELAALTAAIDAKLQVMLNMQRAVSAAMCADMGTSAVMYEGVRALPSSYC